MNWITVAGVIAGVVLGALFALSMVGANTWRHKDKSVAGYYHEEGAAE